ncbi:MAG: hypothetical protein VB119_00910 [Candidatus Metalachnospira sp.]|nr:hypothetical protein [Candidatus Metalachnospira sp.]
MKKNYVKTASVLMLSAVLMMGFSACSKNTANEPAQNETIHENDKNQSVEVPENVQSMFEPADALLMCMVEGNYSYNPKDPEFFWTAIYDFTGVYGAKHSLSKVTDTALIMPRQAVQEYAIALFSDYDDLLELPDSLSDRIKYDAATDTYSFGLGDRGASKSEITGFTDNGDGSFTMDVALTALDENKLIRSGEFTIVPNEYADSISDPLYNFSISNVNTK